VKLHENLKFILGMYEEFDYRNYLMRISQPLDKMLSRKNSNTSLFQINLGSDTTSSGNQPVKYQEFDNSEVNESLCYEKKVLGATVNVSEPTVSQP